MARRPKKVKLVENERLRDYVQDRLAGNNPLPGRITGIWSTRRAVARTQQAPTSRPSMGGPG
jgi:hypothetical protein